MSTFKCLFIEFQIHEQMNLKNWHSTTNSIPCLRRLVATKNEVLLKKDKAHTVVQWAKLSRKSCLEPTSRQGSNETASKLGSPWDHWLPVMGVGRIQLSTSPRVFGHGQLAFSHNWHPNLNPGYLQLNSLSITLLPSTMLLSCFPIRRETHGWMRSLPVHPAPGWTPRDNDSWENTFSC